jgi:hypothetical protein
MVASPRFSRLTGALGASLVGVLSFLIVVGPGVIRPTNIEWLRDGADAHTMYLGWAFFRHSPWSQPIGLNPDYGLELGSAILYADSIPLLALLLKPLSPLLPEPFQYFGAWLLAAFVLQALSAWWLVGLVTQRQWVRVLASALFVFAPPFLFRLGGHWALVGQWQIIAALCLVLRPSRDRQTGRWVLLLTCCALVHTYLLAMIALLWVSAWVGDAWTRRRRVPTLAVEAALVSSCVLVALWQAGFFTVGSGKGTPGFGLYRMNLNTLINPYGWSYVLPTLDSRAFDYEGFAFLGLGGLALAVLAIPAAVGLGRRGDLAVRREWVPLVVVLGVLTVAAASNRVAFGHHEFTYQLPDAIAALLSVFRSSGRLFWPVFYVLLLVMVAAIDRGYAPRPGVLLIAVAIVVQVFDTSAGWGSYRARFHEPTAFRTPLVSGFWFQAPSVYKRVRLVPPDNKAENWAVFADYAQAHGLATDAVYLARVDLDRATDHMRRTGTMLSNGAFDPETIYILQRGTARVVPCAIDPDRDQLAFIDGFWVLAPRWKSYFGDRFAGQAQLSCPTPP